MQSKTKYICLKYNEKHEPIGYQILISRVINREKLTFTRFFSKKRYGTMEAALDAATEVSQAIISELDVNGRSAKSVFLEYRLGCENRVTNAQAGKGDNVERVAERDTTKKDASHKRVSPVFVVDIRAGVCRAFVDEHGICFDGGMSHSFGSADFARLTEIQQAFMTGYNKGRKEGGEQ